MNSDDKKEFAQIMAATGEVFSKELTKTIMSVYFETLKRYPMDDVRLALGEYMNKGKFFPKPADISEIIAGKEMPIADRALLAWSEVENAIRRVGSWGSPNFTDPITPAAVGQLGSWADLCMTPVDKLQWKQKEFMQAFELFERTPQECLPSHVKGRIDLQQERLENKESGSKLIDGINKWRDKNGINKLEVKK